MTNVFISYRRSDTTSGYASWIYDRLAQKHGAEHVFMDLDSLPLGVDFVEHLEKALEMSDVALILIGPAWLGATLASGRRRLDDPGDFVRLEVAAALRASTRVIPVLIDGAQLPEPEELPEELRPLTRRQSLTFQRQGGAAINNLLATIEAMAQAEPASSEAGAHGPPPPVAPRVRTGPEQTKSRARWRRHPFLWLTGAGILAIAILAAVLALEAGGTKRPSGVIAAKKTKPSTPTTPTTSPGATSSTKTTQPAPASASGSSLGPQLNSTQQAQVLVSQSLIESVLGANYASPNVDSSNYALFGGIQTLSLCSQATVAAPGFAGDEPTSYVIQAYGTLPTAYVGSDVATFNGQGAVEFMANVRREAATCQWLQLSNAPIPGNQVIRLTTQQVGPDQVKLNDDLILVRDGPNVLEVGSATGDGTHSAEALTWAKAGAQSLAHAMAGG